MDLKRIDSEGLLIISRFRALKPWLKPTKVKRKIERRTEAETFFPTKREKRKIKVGKDSKYLLNLLDS